jgi:hypothetical protein
VTGAQAVAVAVSGNLLTAAFDLMLRRMEHQDQGLAAGRFQRFAPPIGSTNGAMHLDTC